MRGAGQRKALSLAKGRHTPSRVGSPGVALGCPNHSTLLGGDPTTLDTHVDSSPREHGLDQRIRDGMALLTTPAAGR
jgi:hypothetical protein